MTAEQFWQDFLKTTGREEQTNYTDCFHFELSERLANELLALVLTGKKRATAGSLYAYTPEEIPKPGNLSIVTDWDGNPRCVIETKEVRVIPFREMTFEICSREGEDDNLESWKAGHSRFFTEDGKEMGYEFTEDMPVVFEDFEMIYRV